MNDIYFQKIQGIMSSLEGVELKENTKKKFRFKFYLTDKMLNTPIEELDLSVRSYHSLKRAGYETIGALATAVAGGESLGNIRNCGKKSVREIMVQLFLYNYYSMSAGKQEKYLLETVLLNKNSTE